MSERFHISETNPNDTCGGGGCLCSDTKTPETKGPFIIFYVTEMSTNVSPYVVLCAGCARASVRHLDTGEILSAGESNVVQPPPGVEVELVSSGRVSPVTEDLELPTPVRADIQWDDETPEI